MKIGVLADTHIPDRCRTLPARVVEIFSSVEIILHAGDITQLGVLQQLQESVSLTFAVYGERDPEAVRAYLQETQVLEFGGRRVGLIHGHRDPRAELNARVRGWLGRRQPYDDAFIAYLLGRFSDVDAIVFGHTHQPYAKIHNGVFLFNPGSLVPRAGAPSVGLLEIDARGIGGRILPV